MKADRTDFMGRLLSVAISAPPSNPDKHRAPVRHNLAGFEGTRKPLAKTEQRSRISFVPASVQKAATSTKDAPAAAMSNDDFRKMLMK